MSQFLPYMFYNFGRIHKTLRVTPAMEAGKADHVWSLEEIADLAKLGRTIGEGVLIYASTAPSLPMVRIVQSYESFGLRKTYSAAILPSRTMMTSSPV